jgi:ribonucleoside-diphosphate reductase alpha chain
VPLKALVDKFSHTRFDPSGFTTNREIPMAKSPTDYIFRYLGNRFLAGEPEVEDEQEAQTSVTGLAPKRVAAVAGGSGARVPATPYGMVNQADAPSCQDCGSIMVRSGACYKCANCGGTSGCS